VVRQRRREEERGEADQRCPEVEMASWRQMADRRDAESEMIDEG